MKTTIDLPDEIFRRTKATAALQGETLREFVIGALEARLETEHRPLAGRSGWRSVFGLARPADVEPVDRIVAEELENIDPAEWA